MVARWTADLWFDPSCPASRTTARWLAGVAAEARIDVEWPVMSLSVLNEHRAVDPEGDEHGYLWIAARIGTAVRERYGSAALAAFHDALWERTGLGAERTVLGGFSMGSVMSHALGLGPDRPAPAGILALSGFVPQVEGWRPDLGSRTGTRAFVAHGRNDPVIEVGFGRRARELLEAGGLDVEYHEGDGGHQVDPAHVPAAAGWLRATL